ncbi:MAG: hypothetical protein C0609_06255 [Deltaproteobacteria bacterium]|nr:MAG: hypothetical protein C0609_06255 [Deltaproteobacteria bacterium]
MCGRFAIASPRFDKIEGALGTGFPEVRVSYNIAPGSDIPTISLKDGRPALSYMRWGLVPSWSKEPRSKFSTFNARVETACSKPAFSDAFKRRRCIIPVSGFYEWQQREDFKQPWYFTGRGGSELALAGLWEAWEGAEGTLKSCTILVGEANRLMSPVHARMPVILPEDYYAAWLDIEDPGDVESAIGIPFPEAKMECWPVSRAVGNVRNDNPELVERLA